MDALIVLALAAAVAEDAVGAAGGPWAFRKALGLANAVIDSVFVLQFAMSLALALSDDRTLDYLARRQGWIDGLSSLPLLIFVSGPFAFAAAEGFLSETSAYGLSLATTGILGPLRALRSLRLLSFIRLLSRIKGFDSRSTRRHVARAASLGTGAVVLAFLALEALAALGLFPLAENARARSFVSLVSTVTAIAVASILVFAYGPYFARGVGAPVLASIRWAMGDDVRVRALAPRGRDDEEPFVLAELLDERARREAGAGEADEDPLAPWRGRAVSPTSKEELEGLLARASAKASALAFDKKRAGRGTGFPRG